MNQSFNYIINFLWFLHLSNIYYQLDIARWASEQAYLILEWANHGVEKLLWLYKVWKISGSPCEKWLKKNGEEEYLFQQIRQQNHEKGVYM